LLAIPILSGSATYAVKEFMGLRGSLAVKARYRPTFYAILVLATLGGVAMNFLQVDPIRALFVTAVINGLLAPPLLILIVLLGSDRRIMRARVSGALSKSLTWAATGAMTLAAFALVWTTVMHRS
jgi:Mn2+/Fe2+ NRAMP family transporter